MKTHPDFLFCLNCMGWGLLFIYLVKLLSVKENIIWNLRYWSFNCLEVVLFPSWLQTSFALVLCYFLLTMRWEPLWMTLATSSVSSPFYEIYSLGSSTWPKNNSTRCKETSWKYIGPSAWEAKEHTQSGGLSSQPNSSLWNSLTLCYEAGGGENGMWRL